MGKSIYDIPFDWYKLFTRYSIVAGGLTTNVRSLRKLGMKPFYVDILATGTVVIVSVLLSK